MDTNTKDSLQRPAGSPARTPASSGKCAEISVTRWLKVSRREFLRLKREQNCPPGD